MGTSEKVESAACRECDWDGKCPIHCIHLKGKITADETQKEISETPAACRECQIDQCPLHCRHLGVRVPETEARKEAVTAPKTLDYLKVKGGHDV
ncbi:MAG: hypothetical protein A3B07_03310 [Candidatus Yonathbacteria bacterium RIFCSPLOWO2_01_FULL_43_27]|uniref:Uncharacterized protein n=1 Tax=Candidatus Yonathbacteria bacterium RIFCSPLOWO2_01_FULL_43_27 TaxID=1802726 RepID=A0A1G2SCZ8_9BACT|nr:MAG: hypothetical protein A2658_00260 [Candidatus Yonathbacteria bacterium RIFCSPHIGHO2_01_FULL_44_19]OHA82890.1 MAG: hypothetical protein A3B07_03310 [Candidatus Yonathbacteria bacterium RIFCSPLOWO2_01_FULL_43_27]